MAPQIPILGAILLLIVTLSSIDPTESKQPAFKFMNQLQGCHKGQKVSGIHQLKQYLERFGYLSNASYNHPNQYDLFDDVLESAVKSYQQFYHLQVTGTLNSETMKLMTMPRCGVPDIVKENHPHSHYHHNRKLIHAVSRYAFFNGNPRWAKSMLTYTFFSSVSVPAAQSLSSACARAFQKWANVSNFTFQEVAQSSKADIVIGFHVGDHGDGIPFDGPGGFTAHAFAPSIGLLHFDGDENWNTNPGPNQMDLESIALHEIGHVLGLQHDDTVPDAVMYSILNYGNVKRNLHPDDIAGIRALYGLQP
ncbi:metalloendoproteinase 5-MMP-like [Humulus lupulus]|uniref:metalloendoproteinase 5-MMP-like n=1 Tax=Humulus lupulus TaxID=3486 RepID=UPI002B403E27|nr:metalloendoproteinase 5-MMP-like [Humulus lupulus]